MDLQIVQFLNSFTGKSVYSDALFIFLAVYFPIFFTVGLSIYFIRLKKIKLLLWTLAIAVFAFFSKEIISLFYFRIRPFGTIEGINNLINKSITDASFPSGHTLVVFALAFSVFWLNKRWGILFLIGAFLIAISRVIVGVHYPTDILAGIFIAFVLSFLIRKKS